MSLKESKKVETNRYELNITIDGESFQSAIKQVYRKNVGKMSVPGFRKGKAPQSIIEKHYGESVFFEDALNLLYGDAVESAVGEAGLDYVDDKVDFDLVSIDKTNGIEFKVVITVNPEILIDGYKGLKAEHVIPTVTDEEIEAELGRMAERNSRLVSIEDRAAVDGDITIIDFEGFVDDKAFEGGKGESYSLTLGSNQFIPGFEEQIVGHNNGDEFDVNVEFPAEYQAAELAGKPAVFKVKLHEIKNRELPAIDDEFAKDVSEFDTLAELKADLTTKAMEKKTKSSDDDVENQLIDQLIDLMKAEIPEAMINNRAEQSVQDFEYRLKSQGMDLNTYMQYTGSTVEEFKKSFAPQAERQVKIRLALEKIAELENVKPTDEDIAAEFEKLSIEYKTEIDKIKSFIPEKELIKDLSVGKAIEFVKSNAVISDVEAKSEKVAAVAPVENSDKADDSEEKKAKKVTKKATTKKTTAKETDKTEE
ncbi:MAG: trigger factor [Oscillospiraceae bacterium]|nr:trigger factor [Oscillospiraceae bacterium]